jgi:glycosyltransferase involved in cell wall biosynthesis
VLRCGFGRFILATEAAMSTYPIEEPMAPGIERLRARDDAIVQQPQRTDSVPTPRQTRKPVRRLKICYVAETLRTGVGRHLVDLVEAMTERGHEVHLLHSVGRADPNFLGRIGQLPGARHKAFAMRREPHWSDIGIVLALARYARKWGPFDVVHGHSSKGGAYARLVGTLVGGKRVYTPHAFVTMSPQLTALRRTIYARAELGLSYLSDQIICCSDLERAHAGELEIRPENLAVVHHGLSPFEHLPRQIARGYRGLAADVIIIGFVGRLDGQKAPDMLVEAAARVIGPKRKLHVIVVGDGPLRESLLDLTRRLRMADAFSWLGEVPARDWLAAFDILAMPSRYEGFSYVLLEALHIGLPVVCTPVGGVLETIQDGVNGFVVPHNDVAALAHRLAQLVDDVDLRTNMGMRSRQRSAQFSVQRMADRIEEIYLS